MSVLSKGCIFALGNPLLDITAEVTPVFLEKYGLKRNSAILAVHEQRPMYQEMVDKFQPIFTPGGATLNTIRYCQWLIGENYPEACTFVGCVGTDAYASTLKDLCVNDGVNVQFYQVDNRPTGTCAVCITGQDRSLVANLAAADCYNKDSHLKTERIWSMVEKAELFYSAGYPLTVTPDGMLTLAEYACANDKVYCLNLSAEFLCQFFQEHMSRLLPYTDYLFGGQTESEKFSEANGGPKAKDTREIAKWASTLPKSNKNRNRFVILNQGLDTVIVASNGEIILELELVKTPKENIVDLNSIGDSFVGGFIAGLAQGFELPQCVKLGQAASRYCVQKTGSVFEKEDRGSVLSDARISRKTYKNF